MKDRKGIDIDIRGVGQKLRLIEEEKLIWIYCVRKRNLLSVEEKWEICSGWKIASQVLASYGRSPVKAGCDGGIF